MLGCTENRGRTPSRLNPASSSARAEEWFSTSQAAQIRETHAWSPGAFLQYLHVGARSDNGLLPGSCAYALNISGASATHGLRSNIRAVWISSETVITTSRLARKRGVHSVTLKILSYLSSDLRPLASECAWFTRLRPLQTEGAHARRSREASGAC